MTYEISRRTALQGAGAGAFALFLSNAAPRSRRRPRRHFGPSTT